MPYVRAYGEERETLRYNSETALLYVVMCVLQMFHNGWVWLVYLAVHEQAQHSRFCSTSSPSGSARCTAYCSHAGLHSPSVLHTSSVRVAWGPHPSSASSRHPPLLQQQCSQIFFPNLQPVHMISISHIW